jgi:hypothetical protein
MHGHSRRDSRGRREVVERVDADRRGRTEDPAPAHEKTVQRPVHQYQTGGRGQDRRRSSAECGPCRHDRAGRACAMPPAKVEDVAVDAALEQQPNPRNAASCEVGPEHRSQRPPLQVRPLYGRIELDPGTRCP